ncbi:MAG TPA: hypothetical protein VHM27_00405, partial [Rhizomicrobium sp.]|nr:hypothetical protein [Rhizomicrobium sp.]
TRNAAAKPAAKVSFRNAGFGVFSDKPLTPVAPPIAPAVYPNWALAANLKGWARKVKLPSCQSHLGEGAPAGA